MTTAIDLPPGITAQLKVGLEIHVELATRSKLWTTAPNVAHAEFFDAEPNSLLDPVVLGMPGVLPVLNRAAVEMSIKVGQAMGCRIAHRAMWDRKSYYYPDLPKNYQISQYEQPLCAEGSIEIPLMEGSGRVLRIGIVRAHLEEDAGKLLHEAPGGLAIDGSIVDLNRAGTPLLEIVTEPDFDSADDAVTFCTALRDICRHLGVSEGIMQRGHMRFEPNINVLIEQDGQCHATPIVEIKNLNSFKAVHAAIEYEHHRQIDEWLETGRTMGARAKTTRGWDDERGVSVLQREKEDADEYRYFPDPDLVVLEIDEQWLMKIAAEMPELPQDRLARYVGSHGLDPKHARQLIDEPATARFYDAVVNEDVDPKRAAAMLLNLAAKRANDRGCRIDHLGIQPRQIKQIADLVASDKISSTGADDLFGFCCQSPQPAEDLAQIHGLLQVSDTGELESWIDQVLNDSKNCKAIDDIRGGKDKAIGALVGKIMKLSKGKANPKRLGEMLKSRLQ